MNKEYALDILETIERGMLEPNCSLAKEAYRYLLRLKSTQTDVFDRIYKLKYK